MRKKRAGTRIRTADPRYNDVTGLPVHQQHHEDRARSIWPAGSSMIRLRSSRSGQRRTAWTCSRRPCSNARPVLEVKARRVGGATYQVPTEVRSERSVALAIRWLIRYARARKERSMSHKLAAEFIAASNGEGKCHQEEGRYPQNGRGQQSLCPFPVVREERYATTVST